MSYAFNALCQAKNKNSYIGGLGASDVSDFAPKKSEWCWLSVWNGRCLNLQLSIFNYFLPRGCQGGLAEFQQTVLSTTLLVLSTKYFLLSRKSIYMHAPLAVHACTKLGTTAQILQRTYKKYFSGLREKRIALCEKWAMRFVEKACAFFWNGTALFQRRQVCFFTFVHFVLS